MMSPYRFLAAALLALAGCGAVEWRSAAETEALLAAAGFQICRADRIPWNRALLRA
jgi:hypothetical protein